MLERAADALAARALGGSDRQRKTFLAMPEADKLKTAAYYEVVARRAKGTVKSFAGQTFTPAGTGTRPALSGRQEALRDASNEIKDAYFAGLDLHGDWRDLFNTPTRWSAVATPGVLFSDAMPFWSKVELLTVHTRLARIDPAGPPAVRPVTAIDLGLSEEVTRRLSATYGAVPKREADVPALENKATAAERTAAAANVAAEKALIIKLVVRDRIGSITGSLDRDLRVIARMAQGRRRSDYFQKRTPASFT